MILMFNYTSDSLLIKSLHENGFEIVESITSDQHKYVQFCSEKNQNIILTAIVKGIYIDSKLCGLRNLQFNFVQYKYFAFCSSVL